MQPSDRDRILDQLADEQVAAMLAEGRLIHDLDGFRQHIRRQAEHHEQIHPGFLAAAAHRLAGGPKLTYCREVRGTHGIDHVYDPTGTDRPPEWWNRAEAEAIARRRRIHTA